MEISLHEIEQELDTIFGSAQYNQPQNTFTSEQLSEEKGVSIRTAQRKIKSMVKEGKAKFCGFVKQHSHIPGVVVTKPIYEMSDSVEEISTSS